MSESIWPADRIVIIDEYDIPDSAEQPLVESDLVAIERSVGQRLAELPPLNTEFSRLLVRREAVALPPQDVDSFFRVREAIRLGIADVWGRSDFRLAEPRLIKLGRDTGMYTW